MAPDGDLNLLCTNCGKDIPFTGKVCPWCNHGKTGDQTIQFYVLPFAVLVAGGIGYLLGGVIGAVIGSAAGVFVTIGLFVAWPQISEQSSEFRKAQDALREQLAQSSSDGRPSTQTNLSTTPSEAASRLSAIEDLKKRGLISNEEFEAKRRRIIEEL